MRQLFTSLSAVSLALVLVACGGGGQSLPPTATSQIDPGLLTIEPGEFDPDPFSTPIPEDADFDSEAANPGLDATLVALGAPPRDGPVEGQPTLAPFGGISLEGVSIPAPGVIERVEPEAAPPDPEALPTPSVFDYVEVFRGGGLTNDNLRIRFLNDGNVLINGEPARNIGPQGVNLINQRLSDIDFYTISGFFAASIPNSDDYQYVITAQRGAESVSIRADDTLIPPELARLTAELLALGQGAPPPPSAPQPPTD
ncbi:MAG: hypothetical protein AAF787_22115 [Chloroflexota bacterium]